MTESQIFLSTTKKIPGYRIVEHRGLVFGITVRSRGAFGDHCAQCESCIGGEVSAYTSVVIDSRNEALDRMIKDARARGANAIIGIRIDKDELGPTNPNQRSTRYAANNATIVMGTAVIIKKE